MIFDDPDVPAWWKVLNLPEENFERTKYAAPLTDPDSKGRFRLKDVNILRKLAPEIYDGAAREIKNYEDVLLEHKGTLKKYNLGKKIGSIPMLDVSLRPELAYDESAQNKYWEEHPELKVK